MADRQSRGGEKQGDQNQADPEQGRHVRDEERAGNRADTAGGTGKRARGEKSGGRADEDELGENA